MGEPGEAKGRLIIVDDEPVVLDLLASMFDGSPYDVVACATGTRAAAPADAFHAVAVIPAARRSGTTTPCAPNAAADRTTAPRFRGSVTPSSTTRKGGSRASAARSSRSSGCAYTYGGTWSTNP